MKSILKSPEKKPKKSFTVVKAQVNIKDLYGKIHI